MKLIPENHVQAISWVSQAWHRVFRTPAETAEILAKICGCNDWQELSVHITNQRGSDFEPNGYVIITPDIADKISPEAWGEIRARQGVLMASVFDCHGDLKDAITHSLLESLFILDIAAIADNSGLYEQSIHETLRSIYIDKSEIERVNSKEKSSEPEDSKDNEVDLLLPIAPERYANFSKSLGWRVAENTINKNYTPFHKSFDFEDMHGGKVPVFILRMDSAYRLGGEHFEDSIDIVKRISNAMGAAQAVIFSSRFLSSKDDEANIVTSLGFLIQGERDAMAMHVSKSMKSIEALFDLNEKFYNLEKGSEKNSKPIFPKFIIDTDLHMAKLFNRYVPQE